jgi:hypothetical protein
MCGSETNDLWGPYSVPSINKNLYYASFVDDCTKKGKVDFLKAQGRNPKYLRVDQGKEFNNKELLKMALLNA